jgi:hypothetical protein
MKDEPNPRAFLIAFKFEAREIVVMAISIAVE